MMSDLDAQWRDLEATAEGPSYVVSRPLNVATADGPVRVGLDASGVRHLLVPVARREDVVEDRRSRGVVVVAQQLKVGDEEPWFADVVCTDSRLSDIFASLCRSLCDEVAETDAPPGRIPSLILGQWRDLLAGARQALSKELIIGLLGELTFLGMAEHVVGPAVLEAWKGPSGAAHDFSSTRVSVEVKTTSAADRRRVRVHGLHQLLPASPAFLHVFFARVREDPGGTTLHETVERLLSRFPRRALLERLAEVGYVHGDLDGSDTRWSISDTDLYLVGPDFPKLTVDELVAGAAERIEDVSYVIDLLFAPNALEDDAVKNVYLRLLP